MLIAKSMIQDWNWILTGQTIIGGLWNSRNLIRHRPDNSTPSRPLIAKPRLMTRRAKRRRTQRKGTAGNCGYCRRLRWFAAVLLECQRHDSAGIGYFDSFSFWIDLHHLDIFFPLPFAQYARLLLCG